MKVRVLGCDGGIGGEHSRTTSLLVDQDILIDAGTGLTELSSTELMLIDHVFITHSHLDHIAALPLMIDSVAELRDKPVTIHATAPALESIRSHIFNWAIWPDFSTISVRKRLVMQYEAIAVGQKIVLGNRSIAALPANHTVPAVGFHLASGNAGFVYTGDTSVDDMLWSSLNEIEDLRYLIIETAFPDRDESLAHASKHLCPRLLELGLERLSMPAEIFITHLKPGQADLIMSEIRERCGHRNPRMLQNDQVFEF